MAFGIPAPSPWGQQPFPLEATAPRSFPSWERRSQQVQGGVAAALSRSPEARAEVLRARRTRWRRPAAGGPCGSRSCVSCSPSEVRPGCAGPRFRLVPSGGRPARKCLLLASRAGLDRGRGWGGPEGAGGRREVGGNAGGLDLAAGGARGVRLAAAEPLGLPPSAWVCPPPVTSGPSGSAS